MPLSRKRKSARYATRKNSSDASSKKLKPGAGLPRGDATLAQTEQEKQVLRESRNVAHGPSPLIGNVAVPPLEEIPPGHAMEKPFLAPSENTQGVVDKNTSKAADDRTCAESRDASRCSKGKQLDDLFDDSSDAVDELPSDNEQFPPKGERTQQPLSPIRAEEATSTGHAIGQSGFQSLSSDVESLLDRKLASISSPLQAVLERTNRMSSSVGDGIEDLRRQVSLLTQEICTLRNHISIVQASSTMTSIAFGSYLAGLDIRDRLPIVLANVSDIYCGETYIKTMTSFILTFVIAKTANALSNRGSTISTMDIVLRTIMWSVSRKPVESSAKEQFSTSDLENHKKFRIAMNKYVITVFENSHSEGIIRIKNSSGLAPLEKPFWMQKGFVSDVHIINGLSQSVTSIGRSKSKAVVSDIIDVHDYVSDNDVVAEELVRRLNMIHTAFLNKARERCREVFYETIGFLWDDGVDGSVISTPEALDLVEENIPTAVPGRHNSSSLNELHWRELVEKTEKNFTFVVSYSVQVKQQGLTRADLLQTSINVLHVSLLVWLRLTGHSRTQGFLSGHEKSFLVLVLTAQVLREVMVSHSNPSNFFQGTGSDFFSSFIKMMCPPSASSRSLIRKKKICISIDAFSTASIVDPNDPNRSGDRLTDSNGGEEAPEATNGSIEDNLVTAAILFADRL